MTGVSRRPRRAEFQPFRHPSKSRLEAGMLVQSPVDHFLACAAVRSGRTAPRCCRLEAAESHVSSVIACGHGFAGFRRMRLSLPLSIHGRDAVEVGLTRDDICHRGSWARPQVADSVSRARLRTRCGRRCSRPDHSSMLGAHVRSTKGFCPTLENTACSPVGSAGRIDIAGVDAPRASNRRPRPPC